MTEPQLIIDTSAMDRLLSQLGGSAEKWLDGIAEEVVNDVKLSFGTSPPGIAHPRGQGRVHIASRPGFPPNVDTGALRASLNWTRAGTLARHINVGVDYGRNLELGIGMAPRPFLTPVIQQWRTYIHSRARDGLIP